MIALCLIASGCSGSDQTSLAIDPARDAGASSAVSAFLPDEPCTGRFRAMDLDHITSGPGDTASTFDGTGSGTAIGDVDGDGDLDVVMGNLSGATTLLRNEGGLEFVTEELVVGRFRQIAIVDVEGDGDRDIVLSTGIGTPVWMQQTGGVFERTQLPDVRALTYAMAWTDLGGDGDLDLVVGSYNAEVTKTRNSPVLGTDTGVIVYDYDGSSYRPTRIAADAQALAIRLIDINADGRQDIVVGNDLATADGVWLDNDGGWLAIEPFPQTAFSTMSLDAGDIDNDGDFDLFSTDMAPMASEPPDLDRYREVNEDMAAIPVPDQIQVPENALLLADDGSFRSEGRSFGVEATGWSWSGVFGDLDSDGFLDLYVVNGMRSDLLFDFLPDARLVEANQVFRNTGAGTMEANAGWDLADVAGGRGMAMGDLDGDGDLDIVVNNLDEAARLFVNELCGGGDLVVDLEWPGSLNSDALGAIITVVADDATFTRSIDAARGYLSGGPPLAHVGMGTATVADVRVAWPDGQQSLINDVPADHRLTVTRMSPAVSQ